MRGELPLRNIEGVVSPAERWSAEEVAAQAPRRESSAAPRLRLRFSLRGLFFLAATIAVGCALWVHTPSIYGRIAACSILVFWAGFGCVMAGDELFVRGGAKFAAASKLFVAVGAPAMLLAVLSGTTSGLMAIGNRFLVSPHSSWSLTPALPDIDERPLRKPTVPELPPRRRRGPSAEPLPAELAKLQSVKLQLVKAGL